MTQDSSLQAATELHRCGDLAGARRLYDGILDSVPDHTLALFRSGLLELQSGHADLALIRLQRAVLAAPDEARHHIGLGHALQALQRWSEAADAFSTALRLDPGFDDAWGCLGVSLQHSGSPARAADAYRRALASRPRDAGVMANLGTALRETGALPEAIELLRAATGLEPTVVSHHVNLGVALCARQDFAAAEAALQHAVELDGLDPEAAFNLGIAQNGLGRPHDAIQSYRSAAGLRPDYTDAHINLGNTLADVGDFGAALSAYDAATRSRPGATVGRNNAACLLRALGRIADAECELLSAVALEPESAPLHDNLGNVRKDAGMLDQAIASYRRSLELEPGSARTHSNLAYALSFQSEEPQPILAECRRWNARFAAPLRSAMDHPNDLAAGRRLRVGYVSADFREHCQSLFTMPLLAHHDHAEFEVFCYSSVKRPDRRSERIAGLADVWRDVRQLDDATLAAVVRADRVDILVDLTMHMADGRPLLFARKPAPVQIAWLAYPGTTGIDAMDFRLSDPRLDPQGTDGDYSERTLRLPDTFWCYDPLTREPPVNALPALERGHLTLGCLNNPCKLTDRTLRLWSAVHRALPRAKFLLMAPPGGSRSRLLQRLAAHGIAAARIEFVGFRPRDAYLSSYHDIDLGLDTFPYNGHTTSFDSLWMGVPVVTRVGRTCVGRAGLSQLHHLDLLDLAAHSDAAFVDAAVMLGNDLSRLSALRAGLRGRMAASPLMDALRFTRHMEDVYRSAWDTYRSTH